MSRSGQFSGNVVRNALYKIADQLDVNPDGARLLHMANNAIFALPEAGLVIRITRSRSMRDRVHKVAQLGAWFPTVNAPTIRLYPEVAQPVAAGVLFATIWEYLSPAEPMPTVDELGKVLRVWHKLPAPVGIPGWNPAATARLRIADAEGLDADDRDWLLSWCDDLEPRIIALSNEHPDTLVHGDAHIGNLLRSPGGDVVFCDFDSTCIGPPQVDLAAVAAAQTWFEGREGVHAALVRSYGYDVTLDPDWPTFRSARELTYVVGGVPLLQSTPGVAEEFRLRLRSIQTRDESVTWTPYAHFGNRPRATDPAR